ncbi:unnamed protein product, partial [Adineta ricciae]
RRVGCFGLYGYDFMIDENMKVWLIEVNVNPALQTNTNTLLQAIPPVVNESILLSIECFEKIRNNQRIFPLRSLKGFRCIYNELERKGSLPYLDQKRTTTTTDNTRKNPSQSSTTVSPLTKPNTNNNSAPISQSNKTNSNNSPPTSPKTLPKINDQQSTPTQKASSSPPIISTRSTQERARLNRSLESFVSSSTTPPGNHSPTSPNETMVMRYQQIQRFKTNFEMLKPATVIAEDWKNLDKTQRDRLGFGGPKSLGHGAIASTSSYSSPASPSTYRQQENWLITGRQLTVVDTKTLGTWLKTRQQEQKDNDEQQQQQLTRDSTNLVERSSQTFGNSSDISSTGTTTNGNDIRSVNQGIHLEQFTRNRPSSAKIRTNSLSPTEKFLKSKEKSSNKAYPWEFDDWYNLKDLTGSTNKSALIYRLMRSRLEANLAKSISANRDQTNNNNKKKVSTSTST